MLKFNKKRSVLFIQGSSIVQREFGVAGPDGSEATEKQVSDFRINIYIKSKAHLTPMNGRV